MNQFHAEFVAEAWLVCCTYGALFAWVLGRYAVWPRVQLLLSRRAWRA